MDSDIAVTGPSGTVFLSSVEVMFLPVADDGTRERSPFTFPSAWNREQKRTVISLYDNWNIEVD